MQDLSVYSFAISILGPLITLTIAVVQILNFLKDRPILKVSSQIETKKYFVNEDRMIEIPVLRIKVVNSGKRPVQLLYLVKVFPKGSNTQTILNDYPGEQEMSNFSITAGKDRSQGLSKEAKSGLTER
jgi:hypothetical protein